MTSYHAQSEPARAAALLEHLRGGADLALVTDAGTPAVSDPGADLVAAWAGRGRAGRADPGRVGRARRGRRDGGRRAALGVRGVPAAVRPRSARAAGAASPPTTRGAVLFEAPRRLAATLRDLAAACGADRPGAVCRELTKLHETDRARHARRALRSRPADGTIPARGEVAIVVGAWAGRAAARRRAPRTPVARARVARRAEATRRPRRAAPTSSASSRTGWRAATPLRRRRRRRRRGPAPHTSMGEGPPRSRASR